MKKRKVKLPSIPFNYGFYVAYWKDIESDPSWKDISEVLKSKPCVCVSTGWLIKKDEDVHILMSDFNYKKETINMIKIISSAAYLLLWFNLAFSSDVYAPKSFKDILFDVGL